MGTLKVVEIMTSLNQRSSIGRVVINPPKKMAPLEPQLVGEIKICCGRAYLSEESFNRHRQERTSAHLDDLWNDRLIEEEDEESTAANATSSTAVAQETAKAEKNGKATEISGIKRSRKGNLKKCNLCGIFVSGTNFKRHLTKSHAPSSKFKCKWCTCKFPTKKSSMYHSSRYHQVEHKKFCWNAATQNKHVISARKMTNVALTISTPKKTRESSGADSKEDFPEQETVQAVNQVFSVRKNKKTHECIFCGKILKNKISFQHHLLIHTGDRPYKCKLCEQSFRHTGNLSRHYKVIHSDELKFQCALCTSRFQTQATLLEHMKRKHKESFAQKDSIIKRRKRISPKRKKRITPRQIQNMEPIKVENGYECGICGKVLKYLLTYRGHRLIHANAFPHKCSKCNAKFRLKSTLDRHLETNHIENGSYVCSLCPCAFISPRSLNRHVQCYHSGKRKRNSFVGKAKVAEAEITETPVERAVSPDISTLGTSPRAPTKEVEATNAHEQIKPKKSLARKQLLATTSTQRKRGNTRRSKIVEECSQDSPSKQNIPISPQRVANSLKGKIAERLSSQAAQVEQQTSLAISNVRKSSVSAVEPERKRKTRKRKGSRLTVPKNSRIAREVKKAKLESKERAEASTLTIKFISPEKGKSRPCSSSKKKILSPNPKRIILKISKRKLFEGENIVAEPEVKRSCQRQTPKKEVVPINNVSVEECRTDGDTVPPAQNVVVTGKKTRQRKTPHYPPPDLQCKVCFKSFASPQCKRLHETLHTGTMQYSCDYCGQQFRLFSTFNFHIKRFENPRGNFLCALCISRCGSEEALNHHMAIHKYKKRNYNKDKSST